MTKLLVITVVLALGCEAGMAQTLSERFSQDPSETAVVYYMQWETETRSSLSPEALRQIAPVVVTIRDVRLVSEVRRWLDVLALQPGDFKFEDTRLVVDFLVGGQKRESYYASYFNLRSEDSKRGRAIDDTFRNHFRVLE